MSGAVITPAMPATAVGERLTRQKQDQGRQSDREPLKHTSHGPYLLSPVLDTSAWRRIHQVPTDDASGLRGPLRLPLTSDPFPASSRRRFSQSGEHRSRCPGSAAAAPLRRLLPRATPSGHPTTHQVSTFFVAGFATPALKSGNVWASGDSGSFAFATISTSCWFTAACSGKNVQNRMGCETSSRRSFGRLESASLVRRRDSFSRTSPASRPPGLFSREGRRRAGAGARQGRQPRAR
jgi:hypothetical protein